MKHILFICSWNSIRSQMAEGLARQLGGCDFEVRSAGINAGGVNADAVRAMFEIGVDISGQTSDRLTATHFAWADVIVTVCDSARNTCPTVPEGKVTLHWSIPDPYGNYSSEKEQNESFARVRGLLAERIAVLFETIRKGEL